MFFLTLAFFTWYYPPNCMRPSRSSFVRFALLAIAILSSIAFALDGQIETLDTVGKAYGLTRERIRQIESKVLKSDYVRDLFSDLNEGWFSNEAD